MLGREQDQVRNSYRVQVRNIFRRTDQSTQEAIQDAAIDAVILARAKFYTDLHEQVMSKRLSIVDAEKQVAQYNHPQQQSKPELKPEPEQISERSWVARRWWVAFMDFGLSRIPIIS